MDFIWVPDSGSGNSASGDTGSPLSNEFTLFLCGFVVLAGCAALGTLVVSDGIAAAGTKYGMGWVIDLGAVLLNIFPGLGYMFVTTGSLIGVLRSSAPMKRRLIWFGIVQAAAIALWFASTLH